MIVLFVICLIINFLIFLNLEKLSRFINLNDKPDGKLKIHKTKVPLLGGGIFLINILILILGSIFFLKDELIFISFSKREYFSVLFFIF